MPHACQVIYFLCVLGDPISIMGLAILACISHTRHRRLVCISYTLRICETWFCSLSYCPPSAWATTRQSRAPGRLLVSRAPHPQSKPLLAAEWVSPARSIPISSRWGCPCACPFRGLVNNSTIPAYLHHNHVKSISVCLSVHSVMQHCSNRLHTLDSCVSRIGTWGL